MCQMTPHQCAAVAAPTARVAEALAYLHAERGRIISAAWRVEEVTSLGQPCSRFDVTLERDDGQTLRVGGTWDLEEAQILADRYPDCNAMIELLNGLADGAIEDNWDEQDTLFTAWTANQRGSEWIERLLYWLARADLKGRSSINFAAEVAP
jgi:hypothetical protein